MPAGAAHFEHLVTRDPEDQPDLTVDGGRNIDLIPGRVGLRRGIRRQRQTTSRAARRPVLARVGHREPYIPHPRDEKERGLLSVCVSGCLR